MATAIPDPRRWKALALVCAAFFMTVLDVSIVNVALPSIGDDLDFSRDNLQWVITAYAITFGGFLLLGGRAGDLLGRRRVFMIGLVVFTLASFLCGLAWTESVPDRRARASRASARRSSRRRRSRSSRPPSTKAPSATRRSGSGARSAAPAPPSASSPAAS